MIVVASSFADPKDVRAFKKWYATFRSQGFSHEDATKKAFAYGDNGEGCWMDNTASETDPMVALPPDDMIAEFGSIAKAKHAKVCVAYKGKAIVCTLADRMPWARNIKNGAGIDLNPAAIKQLNIPEGAMVKVDWEWD